MTIQRGYTPNHKIFTEVWRPKCARCGQFVNQDSAKSSFVPDSELTVEKTEFFCDKCWEKENE